MKMVKYSDVSIVDIILYTQSDDTLKCYSIGCDEFEWNENNIECIHGQSDDGKVDQIK